MATTTGAAIEAAGQAGTAIIQGSFNLASTKELTKAQKEIAELQAKYEADALNYELTFQERQNELQRQANKEMQEAEFAEAEKAYQRSTYSAQLKQLMDAGYSEQQARQFLMNSNAAAGSYTPANIVNPMQGVDVAKMGEMYADSTRRQGEIETSVMQAEAEARARYLNISGEMVSASANEILSAFTSSNGGSLGTWCASKFINRFNEALPYIDRNEVHNITDLEKWYNTLKDGETKDKIKTIVESRAFKRVKSFLPATRAANSLINELYTANLSTSQQLKKSLQDIRTSISIERLNEQEKRYKQKAEEELNARIGKTDAEIELMEQQKAVLAEQENMLVQQILGAKYANQITAFTKDAFSDYTVAELTALTREMEQKKDWFESGYNCQLWQEAFTATLEGQKAAALLEAMRDDNIRQKIEESPSLRWLTTIHGSMQGAGFQFANSTAAVGGAVGLILKAIPK